MEVDMNTYNGVLAGGEGKWAMDMVSAQGALKNEFNVGSSRRLTTNDARILFRKPYPEMLQGS